MVDSVLYLRLPFGLSVWSEEDYTGMIVAMGLALAGFYGKSDNHQLAMKAVSDVPAGKVKSLKVSGIHDCCGPCCEAIKGAISTVKGVIENTAKPRETKLVVTGDFYAADLVKAPNAAGFSAQVEQ